MSEFVTTRREGRMQHIVLDRPKALNSLDLPMCRALHSALDAASQDSGVEAVVTTSTSEKAFCAGGDIRALRDAAAAGEHQTNREFFSEEYAMDLAYHTHRVPTVAVIHGVAMGGGLGISINGSHRVVTKKVMMAMPETAIGFIPDVGASHFLPRLCGGGTRGLAVGTYLGTTGVRMNSADALYTGLATHLIDDSDRDDFVTAIASDGLDAALARYGLDRSTAGESAVEQHIDRIEDVFSRGTVQEMVAALQSGVQDEWATATLEMLRSHCPTSVIATIELLRAGAAAADLRECLDNELALGGWITARPDFVEGVRAVVIDKDRNPTWDPADLDDVHVDAIRSALTVG
ncbi:enoyl-CoA hydratase/isomerase family protein [Dietzia sp. SLG310A2-38A2]|uniref:enoyl-CoA hydratase/isomerase family protein n=1 Tax=Dietzia sp. SLG310A2-38A2 TaxID=1630643 RepID=UPI0015FE3875|nr:enoyl-CoA hydratase/isomerase family protein [Dietzia sp. SLG310A2-38A2]MBB1031024.1 enoyl-CoA hydratase/isomerase family protein [Dietzia sp. SLG310A2-38A2]